MHARALATAQLTGLFVALALVGAGAASHSELTVSLSPKVIDHGMWRNFTVTVRNEGPEPVNVTEVHVAFSWSRFGYVTHFDYASPAPIPVGDTRSYRLGDLNVAPVPTEGVGQLYLSLETRHWNFTFEVAFSEPTTIGLAMPLELVAGIAIVAVLVVALILLVLVRLKRRRPDEGDPDSPRTG